MTLIRWTFATAAWFLLISAAHSEEQRAPDPLFQSNEILDVRIVAPISTILRKRPIDEELPGTFQFTNSDGELVEFEIKLRTRGKFRRDRENCRYPPLRLNFRKSQTKNTLFHKQNKVKLVTHCQNASRFTEVLLREYVAYRLLNVMTDASFRVRLLRITYVNNERDMKETVEYGFVIEHKTRLAKRMGMAVLDINSTVPGSLNPEYANIISFFHYLIGNTDFSSVKSVKGEVCCHNHVLFASEGQPVMSVPYDFDQAGLVDAPYAEPNPQLRIRSVKQRLYRGRCIHNGYITSTIAAYQGKQRELLQLVTSTEVASSGTINLMTDYVEKFFQTLSSAEQLESRFIKKCI